jgi:hypothetical protein
LTRSPVFTFFFLPRQTCDNTALHIVIRSEKEYTSVRMKEMGEMGRSHGKSPVKIQEILPSPGLKGSENKYTDSQKNAAYFADLCGRDKNGAAP